MKHLSTVTTKYFVITTFAMTDYMKVAQMVSTFMKSEFHIRTLKSAKLGLIKFEAVSGNSSIMFDYDCNSIQFTFLK